MKNILRRSYISQFLEHGYLVFPEVFTKKEVAMMRSEADRILELIINSSISTGRTSKRLDLAQNRSGQQIVRKIQPVNDLSLYLSRIATDERLISPLRRLMNDDPVLMEEKLNYKEPLPDSVVGLQVSASDSTFPIHNDWAYYRREGYPKDIISSAISMDDCTVESGPIRIWPGTHMSHLEHEKTSAGLQVLPNSVDLENGKDILVPAGSVMLFHVLLIHSSSENVSGIPRRLMIYSHFPQKYNIGFDVRNGRTRFTEAPYEWDYIAKLQCNEVSATFKAPNFDNL